MLDTSVIYSIGADTVLAGGLLDAITEYRQQNFVTVHWHMPEMVVMEREEQLIAECLQSLERLERAELLTGVNFGITREAAPALVRKKVGEIIKGLGISVRRVEPGAVDWHRIMMHAARRLPPFQQGKSEKGFKDAIIAECFDGLMTEMLDKGDGARVVLAAGDGLLRKAVTERTGERAHVFVVPSVDAMRSVVTAIIQNSDEALVARLQELAGALFFTSSNQKECLYYKGGVRKVIEERFAAELRAVPKGAQRRQNGTFFIGKPSFVRREDDRVTWAVHINVESKGVNTVMQPRLRQPGEYLFGSSLASGTTLSSPWPGLASGTALSSPWSGLASGTTLSGPWNPYSGGAYTVNADAGCPLIADLPVLRTPTILSPKRRGSSRPAGDAQFAVVTSSDCGCAWPSSPARRFSFSR